MSQIDASANTQEARQLAAFIQPIDPVLPPPLGHRMSLAEIAQARAFIDQLEQVTRKREQALAEIKAVLEKFDVVLNDLGLTEVLIEPDEEEAATATAKQRGTRKSAAKKKSGQPQQLKKVLKADRTIPFTGGRCNKLGRDRTGQKMDPSKWVDPSPEELRRWTQYGSLV